MEHGGFAGPDEMRLIAQSVILVRDHPADPKKQEILDEVERDIESRYACGRITMQQRLQLLILLSAPRGTGLDPCPPSGDAAA